MITYRPIKDEEYLSFFNQCYQNSFFYNNMPDDIIIQDFGDLQKAFDAIAAFIVTKDGKDIGCFILTYNESTNTNSAYAFVHPRSCKLGFITITTLSLLVLLHNTPNSVGNFVFYTTQRVIANKWVEVWPWIEVQTVNPLLYIGSSSDFIINDKYLLELMATKYPEYRIGL